MTTTVSKRKKYVREITPTWWKSWDFYKFYMLREATAVPTVWFSLVLLYGVICLGKADGFVISLAALLLHAVTLFDMTGEVMSGTTGLPAKLIKNALRGAFVAVTVLALVLVFI